MNRKTTSTRKTANKLRQLRALRFRDRKAPPPVIYLPRVFFLPGVTA